MRHALLILTVAAVTTAEAQTVDQMVVMTHEVMDLYVYEPICGYKIYKEKLDIYLLGTPMFWGEPVSQDEIDAARAREVALIGNNEYEKSKRCRLVSENFGPLGHRARGIAR